MDSELKAKWIAALRSGEYKQAQGGLEKLDDQGKVVGNCCLGVLCRIAGLESSVDMVLRKVRFDDSAACLTAKMQDKFGITKNEHRELIRLNDLLEKNFQEIADFIERNL